MRPPLRIAILECDTPLEHTRTKYGGYGGVFKALLQAGADGLGQPDMVSSKKGMAITKWGVEDVDAYPNTEDIDAILITGSRHNSFENKPWIIKLVDFVAKILAGDRVRVIGVCFGHQIVGRAMGVKVDRSDAGWETSVTPVDLSSKGQEIFRQQTLSIHQMHRDIVYGFPNGVEDLGSSPRCRNQGMYVAKKLITVQGHPEFDAEIVTELLEARHAQGIFDDAVYTDSMARVSKQHDGVVVAQAFLRFLLDD